MKKLTCTLLVSALLFFLAVPALAAALTHPSWCPAEEYAVFENSTAYTGETREKILSLQEYAAAGHTEITRNSDSESHNACAIFSLRFSKGVSVDELLCDNIHRSEQIYSHELSDLLQDCTVDELHIISELATVIKKAGINSAKKARKRRTKAEMAAARAAEEATKVAEA